MGHRGRSATPARSTSLTRMAEHFESLLDAIILNPNQSIELLPLLREAENHRLVVECGWTPARYRRWLAETMAEQTLAPQFRH